MQRVLHKSHVVSVVALVAIACSSDRSHTHDSPHLADSSAARAEVFHSRGLVTSIMPNRKHIIVDHEDIPGFMSAMEMPFALKDTSVATGIAAGDSIEFTVEVEGPYVYVTRINVAH